MWREGAELEGRTGSEAALFTPGALSAIGVCFAIEALVTATASRCTGFGCHARNGLTFCAIVGTLSAIGVSVAGVGALSAAIGSTDFAKPRYTDAGGSAIAALSTIGVSIAVVGTLGCTTGRSADFADTGDRLAFCAVVGTLRAISVGVAGVGTLGCAAGAFALELLAGVIGTTGSTLIAAQTEAGTLLRGLFACALITTVSLTAGVALDVDSATGWTGWLASLLFAGEVVTHKVASAGSALVRGCTEGRTLRRLCILFAGALIAFVILTTTVALQVHRTFGRALRIGARFLTLELKAFYAAAAGAALLVVDAEVGALRRLRGLFLTFALIAHKVCSTAVALNADYAGGRAVLRPGLFAGAGLTGVLAAAGLALIVAETKAGAFFRASGGLAFALVALEAGATGQTTCVVGAACRTG